MGLSSNAEFIKIKWDIQGNEWQEKKTGEFIHQNKCIIMLKGIQITDNRKDQVRYSQTLSIAIFESIKPHNTPEKVLHFTAINYNVWKMGKPFNQASTILKLDISSPWNVKLAQLREVQHTRYDVAHTVSHMDDGLVDRIRRKQVMPAIFIQIRCCIIMCHIKHSYYKVMFSCHVG